MKFKVFYSQEKDIQNYLNAGWKFKYRRFGRDPQKFLNKFSQNFQDKLLKAKTRQEAVKVIKDFWKKIKSPAFDKNTELIIKQTEKILNDEGKKIIKSLESLYGKPFPFPKISIYLTTFPINPYNYQEKWFMVNRKSDSSQIINTAKHELNHFMFYYYYSYLKDEAPSGLRPGYLLPSLREAPSGASLRRERNPSEAENSSRSSTSLRLRFSAKGDKLKEGKFEKLKEALAIFTNPEGNDKPEVKELEKYLKTLSGKPMEEIIKKATNSKYI